MNGFVMDGDTLIKYEGSESTVMLDYTVKEIAPKAFANNTTMECIIIPFVNGIGDEAFMNCFNLKDVKVLGPLKTIGAGAFKYCKALKSINLPDTIESIGEGAFMTCELLTTVTLPKCLNVIQKDTFNGCVSLTTVDIPNTVIRIDDRAFANCISITFMVIPDSVSSIHRSSLYDDNEPRSLKVIASNNVISLLRDSSSGITLISVESASNLTGDSDAIYSNNVLVCYKSDTSDYTVIDGTKAIGDYAFLGCKGIHSITLSESVEKIGIGAFAYSSLAKIFISYGVSSIGSSAFASTSLETVFLPDSIKSIGEEAFMNCNSLREIELSNALSSIPAKAFYNCKRLMVIIIPSSVKSIGYHSFVNTSLTRVIIQGTPRVIDEFAFFEKGNPSYSTPQLISLAVTRECFIMHKDSLPLDGEKLIVTDVATNEMLLNIIPEPLIVSSATTYVSTGNEINRIDKLPKTSVVADKFVLPKLKKRMKHAVPDTYEVSELIEEIKSELAGIISAR